jgi:hypothetical protein
MRLAANRKVKKVDFTLYFLSGGYGMSIEHLGVIITLLLTELLEPSRVRTVA